MQTELPARAGGPPRLNDRQWALIAPQLRISEHPRGRPPQDDRLFIDAVRWIAYTGAPWRSLPAYFGNWNSIYKRFNRYAKLGVWERLFQQLFIDKLPAGACVDCTIVRAHQHAAVPDGKKTPPVSGVHAAV